MADRQIEVKKPGLLIVEGKDEEGFFESLLRQMEQSEVQILPIGGKDSLRSNLKALVLDQGFRRLVRAVAIVRDADRDHAAAFQSVCDALESAGLPRPAQPCEPARASGSGISVSVMIIPGCGTGALEDLCLGSVAADPVSPCVDAYFECLRSLDIRPRELSKAKTQVFLASRERAGLRLGEAARAGYWPWNAEVFDTTKDFLKQLAGTSAP